MSNSFVLYTQLPVLFCEFLDLLLHSIVCFGQSLCFKELIKDVFECVIVRKGPKGLFLMAEYYILHYRRSYAKQIRHLLFDLSTMMTNWNKLICVWVTCFDVLLDAFVLYFGRIFFMDLGQLNKLASDKPALASTNKLQFDCTHNLIFLNKDGVHYECFSGVGIGRGFTSCD